MSVIDAAIHELKTAPESVVREAHDFILFLKSKSNVKRPAQPKASPDFLARQKATFGDRKMSDSQVLLDEMGAGRF